MRTIDSYVYLLRQVGRDLRAKDVGFDGSRCNLQRKILERETVDEMIYSTKRPRDRLIRELEASLRGNPRDERPAGGMELSDATA